MMTTTSTSTRVRTAWMAAGSVLAVATLAFATLNVVSALAASTARATTSQANAHHLIVRNDGGSTRLRAASASVVTIARTETRSLSSPVYLEHLDGDRLVIDARCRSWFSSFCAVDLVIDVPAGMDVDATGGGGSVRAEGLDGALRLRSSGGGVTVVGGSGPLDLGSSGGSITVDGSRAAEVKANSSGGGVHLRLGAVPSNVDVRSSGGGVTVEVPDTPDAYLVVAHSSGGPTRTQVRTDPTSSRRIAAASSGGGVTVRYLPATSPS